MSEPNYPLLFVEGGLAGCGRPTVAAPYRAEAEARRQAGTIRADAVRDGAKWGIGGMDRGLTALVQQMRDRRAVLSDKYGDNWKDL